MRWVVRSLIAISVGAAAGALGAIAFAQTQSSAASSFAQSQTSTLNVSSAASSTNVPGFGGDASNLQSYANNPTGLQNAGTAAAVSGDPLLGLTASSVDKRTTSAVDLNADWLKKSINVGNDPAATASSSTGTASTECKEVTKSTTTTSLSMYTCETSRQVTDTAYQCASTLVIDTQTINNYACTSSYNQTTRTWVLSTECLQLGSSGNCTKTGESCTTPGAPYYQTTTCNAGTQWTSTTKTCSQERQVTVDTDYVYQCSSGSSACNTLSRQCTLTNSVCGAVSPPTYQTTSCQQGSTTSTSTTSCQETLVVEVTGGAQQTYSCTEGYVGSSTPATCGRVLNISAMPVYKYGYYLPGMLEYLPSGLDACSQTVAENQPDGWYFEFDCDRPPSPGPSRGDLWLISVAGVITGEDWSLDGGACVAESQGCRRTNSVCTGGSGTRTINGVSVTRSCWGYTDIYQCDVVNQAPGCSVPSGYQLQSSSCSGYTGGSCTQYDRTYVDSNSGKQISNEYWTSNCGSVPGNCSQTGQTVTQPGGTRNINGLNVYRSVWGVQNNYTCSSTQSVDTCGNVSGCSETGRSCANAQCSLYNITYSCMTNPGGTCTRTDNTYQCADQVSGAGSPTGTVKSVAQDSWSGGCDAVKADATCKLSSQTFSGGGTRTIDGLSVTRDSWSSSSAYTCSTSQSVDQCAGKTNGCSQQSRTCIGYDPQGACSLYTYTYRCSADDGSGNCSVKTSGYSCTGSVSGAGSPVSSSTTQTGSHWELSAACPAASDKACQVTATTCTQGPATRTVSGLQITADCWAKTTSYMCSAAGPQQSTCDPPKGCTYDRDECLDDPDPGPGKCITVQHVYKCSSTSTKTTTETQCADRMCLGDSCFSLSETQQNDELPQTFGQLAAMNMAGKSYGSAADLSIFKGEPLRCRKAILGFRNCCKDSGWGLSLGLAQCDDQEKKLINRQDNKATHYVGTYCSNKSFFGACLEKAMSYCGYEGSLARIVQEAGHTQLGKSWGQPKTPDCSGFTVDQFQQLDLSNVDFSDFYSEKMNSLTGSNTDSTVSRIQNSINSLYGTQTNPTGGL